MRILPLALLAACAAPSVLPMSQAPASSSLLLTVDPLIIGEPVDIRVLGAVPGQRVHLIRSDGDFGSGSCPSFLGTNCMDITPGTRGYIPTLDDIADSSGAVQWSFPRFPTIPTGPIALQAVVAAGPNSNESNPIVTDILAPCTDDAQEDNDSLAQASLLAPGIVTNLVVCEEADTDWYEIIVPPLEQATVTIDFDDDGEGDLDLRLYDAAGNLVQTSSTTSDQERVDWFNNTGSTASIFVEVSLFADAFGTVGTPYDITIDVVVPEPCVTDPAEPNNSAATATPLSPGSWDGHVCETDPDWYVFQVDAGETVDASVSFDTMGGTDVDMALYDAGGTLLAEADFNFSSPDPLSYTATSDGPLFLEVYLSADDVLDDGSPYTLDLDLYTPQPCLPDPYEPDDTPTTATLVTPGSLDATACLGDTDFFVVDLLAGELLTVAASFLAVDQDIDLQLIDATGVAVVANDALGSPESFTYTAIADGPVAIEVILAADDNLGGGADYTLDVSVDAPSACVSDAQEPDDSQGSATPAGGGMWSGQACLTDSDWYMFDVVPRDVIDAVVVFDSGEGNVDMNLWSSAGILLASADFTNTSPDPLQFQSRASDTLFLEVFLESDDPSGAGAAYTVDIDLQQPADCIPDAAEPNDSQLEAIEVGSGTYAGTACISDGDWFEIDALAGEQIVADVASDFGLGDVELTLYDDAGTALLSQDSFVYDVTTSGTYFAEIVLASDDLYGGGNTYVFDLFVGDTTCTPDPAEPNDDATEATPITPGTVPGISICDRQDEDWYSVDLLAGQTLDVDLLFSDAEGDLDLYLRDASDSTTLDAGRSNDDDETASYTASSAETVLIRVRLFADGGPIDGNTYTLTASVQ